MNSYSQDKKRIEKWLKETYEEYRSEDFPKNEIGFIDSYLLTRVSLGDECGVWTKFMISDFVAIELKEELSLKSEDTTLVVLYIFLKESANEHKSYNWLNSMVKSGNSSFSGLYLVFSKRFIDEQIHEEFIKNITRLNSLYGGSMNLD